MRKRGHGLAGTIALALLALGIAGGCTPEAADNMGTGQNRSADTGTPGTISGGTDDTTGTGAAGTGQPTSSNTP